MSVFTPEEIEYLQENKLGRLGTADAECQPHMVPLTYFFNEEEDTIDVGGRDVPERSRSEATPSFTKPAGRRSTRGSRTSRRSSSGSARRASSAGGWRRRRRQQARRREASTTTPATSADRSRLR